MRRLHLQFVFMAILAGQLFLYTPSPDYLWIRAHLMGWHHTYAVDKAWAGANTATATLTISLSPTTGADVFVAGTYRKDTCNLAATAITDTSSDTFTVDKDIATGDTHRNEMFGHAYAVAASNTQVIVHFSASCGASFLAGSYTSNGSSFDVVTAAVKTATSGSASTNNIVTTGSNDLVISLCTQATNGTDNFTATAPWGHGTNQANGTDGMVVAIEDQLNVAAATYAGAFTLTSHAWYCIGTSAKESAAGASVVGISKIRKLDRMTGIINGE